MLAEILARPTPTLVPHPARNRLMAPFAAKRGGARLDQQLPAASDDRRRWLAGPLGGELAARRANLLATVPADRRLDPRRAQVGGEPLEHGRGTRGPRRVRDGVHRDQV